MSRMSRRSVLSRSAAITVGHALLGRAAILASDVAAIAGPPKPQANPDEALIRACYRLAEGELDSRYRYVTSPDGLKGDDEADVALLDWITATPATTPEGWQAKALACAAWNRDMYDDTPDERDGGTTLLASLLRDMVAPARNAILTRCEAKYGPLPEGYSPDWAWIGRAGTHEA